MTIERLTLVLDTTEAAALRKVALANYRRPRDQARYLLRIALLGEKEPEQSTNSNRAVLVEGGGAITG